MCPWQHVFPRDCLPGGLLLASVTPPPQCGGSPRADAWEALRATYSRQVPSWWCRGACESGPLLVTAAPGLCQADPPPPLIKRGGVGRGSGCRGRGLTRAWKGFQASLCQAAGVHWVLVPLTDPPPIPLSTPPPSPASPVLGCFYCDPCHHSIPTSSFVGSNAFVTTVVTLLLLYFSLLGGSLANFAMPYILAAQRRWVCTCLGNHAGATRSPGG